MGWSTPTPMWLSTWLPLGIAAVLMLLGVCLLLINQTRNKK